MAVYLLVASQVVCIKSVGWQSGLCWVNKMDSARCWFNKLKSKDKVKSPSKKETAPHGKEGSKAQTSEEATSNVTKQKVAAAKQYIENHYKKQMKSLQERKERYDIWAFFLGNDVVVKLVKMSALYCLSRE